MPNKRPKYYTRTHRCEESVKRRYSIRYNEQEYGRKIEPRWVLGTAEHYLFGPGMFIVTVVDDLRYCPFCGEKLPKGVSDVATQ